MWNGSAEMDTHTHLNLSTRKEVKITKYFKLLPLHARFIGIISQLPDRYYKIEVYKLCILENMCSLESGMEKNNDLWSGESDI